MFSYLLSNKEWLFSGIGVFAVGLMFAGGRLLYTRRARRAAPVGKSAPLLAPTPDRRVSLLTHAEVFDSIENAPLLQRQDVAKHFVGIIVQWQGPLRIAQDCGDGKVKLVLDMAPGKGFRNVWFDVDPSDYPGLSLLKAGSLITVIGRIAKAEFAYVTLDEVQLSFS